MPWLAESVEQLEAGFEHGQVGRGSLFEQGVGQQQQTFGSAFLVAGALGHGHDLLCDGDPSAGPTGCPQHVVAGEQAAQQGRCIAGGAAELEGPFAQQRGPGAILGHRVLQLPRQSRGQPRFWRAIAAQGDESLLELAHDLVAPGRELRPERRHRERDLRQAIGGAAAQGHVPSGAQQASRINGRSRPSEGVGLGDQDIDQEVIVDRGTGIGNRCAPASEVPCRLDERERLPVTFGGGKRPVGRSGRPCDGDGGGEVARQLGRRDVAAPAEAIFQRTADLPVQQ